MNTSSTVSRVTLDVLDSNPPPAAASKFAAVTMEPFIWGNIWPSIIAGTATPV